MIEIQDKLEKTVNTVHSKWPWAFFFLAVLAVAIWAYNMYISSKLEKKWYALQILESEKNLNMTDSSNAINQALSGDKIVSTANKIPGLSDILGATS